MRENYSSGSKWEPIVGYSRAVRVGNSIHVSGTTATDESGAIVGVDDPYRQTVQVIRNIEKALRSLGAELRDVVRTRLYVAHLDHWQEIGRAHQEYFGEILPASTMVEVKLIAPEMLIEMEAEALLSEGGE